MRKIKYFIFTILMMGIMLITGMVSASAYSISFDLFPDEDTGAAISIYELATAYGDRYEYNGSDFEGCGIAIPNFNDKREVQNAIDKYAAYAKSHNLKPYRTEVEEDGWIIFDDIEPRVYLAMQTDGFDNVLINNMLVFTPGKNGPGEATNDVVVGAKHTVLKGKGAAALIKKSDDGAPLAGAKFDLYIEHIVYEGEDAPANVPVYTRNDPNTGAALYDYYWEKFRTDLPSDDNGVVSVDNLPYRYYQFVETVAPLGCLEPSQVVIEPFKVDSEAQSVKIEADVYPCSNDPMVVLNDRTTVYTKKVDGDDKPVIGAVLVVKDANGNVIKGSNGKPKYQLTTAGDLSKDIFRGLPAGTYYLSEVSAPNGYEKADDVKFTVSNKPDAKNIVTMVDIKVKPKTPQKNVKTGDNTPIIPLVIALVVGIAGIGGTLIVKRRNK